MCPPGGGPIAFARSQDKAGRRKTRNAHTNRLRTIRCGCLAAAAPVREDSATCSGRRRIA
ncbi:hypothetical protein BOSEA1005_21208 [Hyphomicrobiales bacterium]|nr:hypothetical protein BOSEA1005_21208 [Hyphomicrobiales bacterium]CAI0345467.1 hypothetical protein BO1005MUT1_390139 [Hyphomicrobiales bacterium]